MARQPVFDRNLNVFGYELLFRSALEDFARVDDTDQASRMTIDSSFLWGFDRLCEGKLALVNCTRVVLTKRLVELLPPKRTVVEVLENIRPDKEILEACRSLKSKGYSIALDDVSSMQEVEPYLGIVEVVKVDFRLADLQRCAELAVELRRRGIVTLAEKVETQEEYRAAVGMGYTLFQGFFFQRPELMRTRDIAPLHAGHFRLLEAVQRAELDYDVVERLVRAEPTLCLRLLRYLNSPLFGFGKDIVSVRHALSLLGEREIRKWLLVSLAAQIGWGKPEELVLWALTRARFCELLAEQISPAMGGSFLMGMLSAFPALLEVPLTPMLDSIPVEPAIKAALSGEPGQYRSVLEIMTAYEAGNWNACKAFAKANRLTEHSVASWYFTALQWARALSEGIANSAVSNHHAGPGIPRSNPAPERLSAENSLP
jgi:c-di-GMP-related signal transduction protein